MNLRNLIITLLIVTALAWTIYTNLLQREGKYIYIAFIGPMSGGGGAAGKIMSQAIQLYFDSINEKGGVNGKQLKLETFDDQNSCDPKTGQAKQEALRIVKENRAVAVIGHWYSSCSITGGEVYKKYGIPAIAPGSVSVKVTEGNEWYFRSIFTSKASGQFLANYMKKVLRQNNVTIIHETAAYGAYLAQVFEETASQVGLTVKNKWSYDPADKNLEEVFKGLVEQLKQTKDQPEEAGALFLSVQAGEGVKLVKLIKEAGLTNLIMGETSLSEQTFKDGFDEFPREKSTPGFYTNDIYVGTPLLFDTANEKAQKFKGEYEQKYGDKPDWSAAYAYDTAMVLYKVIKDLEIKGETDTLNSDRRKIREQLASMTHIHEAVEGTTGFNYFDEYRNAPKPVVIGIYKNKTLISALTQLQVIRNLSEISDLAAAREQERVVTIDNNDMYKTNVVYVGIKINEISDFDPNKLTCKIDFHLWFRFQGSFKPQDIEFLNSVETTEMKEPVVDRNKDKDKDKITYLVYHQVKREFKVDFVNQYAYKQHILGITFRHSNLIRNNLIYVTDELGMGTTQEDALVKQMREAQVLSPSSGWLINRAWFFQDVVRKYSLGDPEFLNVQGGTVEYSRFNTLVQIQKSEFTLRGMLSYSQAKNLMILAVMVTLLLNFVTANQKLRRFSKLVWLFQTVFAFVLLLASEVILVEWMREITNYYMLKTIISIFDILWWMIPAFLLNLAAEHFIWTPLEEKSGRVIPNIVRLFMAFIIYFLAIVGIIAFVYERQMTSILATSGVVAMIIGLAIQINISNVFSGIAINIERPFRIRDWVQIGTYDEGEIVDITWRSTRLKTRADCILSIPNSVASESAILNYCYPDETFWLWPTVYVHPMHQPERVKKILLDALLSCQKILKKPAPVVIFTGINDWAASYWVAFCATDYANKFTILEEVWTRVWFHLNRAGIAPAVQRQEVHWFKGIKERSGEEATKPITLLQEIDIFKSFSEEAKRHLSDKMRRHRFPPGEIVVQQGDEGNSLFIVVEGVVGVRVKKENNEVAEVARLGAGNIFGEMALLTGEQRTATVVAIAETVLYEITKYDIAPLIAQQPEVSELISTVLTQRQLATHSKTHIHHDTETVREDVYQRFLSKIEKFFALPKV